jgi:DNA-binding response OmpR family regulator
VDGDQLIRILRKRTNAGVLVVSGKLGRSVFEGVVDAGADMYLDKPVSLEQILLVTKALQRRAELRGLREQGWVVDLRASQLLAPDGAKVDLSDTDLTVLRCFLDADGGIVTRETLVQRLGRDDANTLDNTLHATIYRLRRRIEKASSSLVPLQSEPRIGYIFRAPLKSL